MIGHAPAPVVLFAYARDEHLRRTVSSLRANTHAAQTDVYIFCDAAKRPEHQGQVDRVRAFAASVDGFRSVTLSLAERNTGLARSVIEGVTHVLARHGRAIVLEDDLELSPHFLQYMNESLQRYEHDERVASIHGYIYPVAEPLPETFFLQGADCWGWATWSRAWSQFETDGRVLLAELRARALCRHFDFDGQYPYTDMLVDQIAGRNDSWAIRWHASCYLKGLLTLYPGRSLVENIGNDSSGTHCATNDAMSQAVSTTSIAVKPIPVEPSAVARDAVIRFFARQRSWKTKLRGTVKHALRSLT